MGFPSTGILRPGFSAIFPAGSGVTTPAASVTENGTVEAISTAGRPSAMRILTVERGAGEIVVPG